MKKSKTNTIGNKGEDFICSILEWRGYNILKKGKDSKWDINAIKDNQIETFEVKTQPKFLDYGEGGFSVEIANRWNQYNYMFREDTLSLMGVKCVPTGLLVTQAETYVFTDGKYIAYFVSTKALKEWFERIITQEEYRITFGGNGNGSLQVQLRLDELRKIADFNVTNLPKKGRRPKMASSLSVN